MLIDPTRKAELLQTIFASMFTTDSGHVPVVSTPPVTNTCLSNVTFTSVLVKRAMCKLKAKSKGGPDGLPPIFIKTCSDQLSTPLAYVYSQCMEFSYLPPDWLRAYITPVFKKGDPSCPLNYRPIALTCTICKIMEVIIKDQLLNYLLRHSLISKHQHGFLIKHSTTTNLLESTQDWIVSFTSCSNVDVAYIDFSRAFDSIVFNKLLAKLEHYGITGKLLHFISAFIHDREQCVVLNNCFSSVTSVLSGVPQGSVLGPILFLIFINDVSSTCIGQAKLKLFADDVKLYSSFNVDVFNCDELQQSLDLLSSWAKSWQLNINISKCTVLSIHHKSKSISPHPYFINGSQLTNSSSVTDLGILDAHGVDRFIQSLSIGLSSIFRSRR
jgi:Reverse transcriptase (RNA-dependent DNA polymerase)